MARIGLMLYTVRAECARDLEGTLRAVAAFGYEGVELADLHAHEPAAVRGWLDELGLPAVARHAGLEAIETRLPELAREAEAIGWRRLVLSWLDPATLGDPGWPERLARAAGQARAHGLELGFHNHAAEVRDGFLARLPAELFVELDLGWVWWAGADPVELLRGLPGRVPLVHVKDFAGRGELAFCAVGEGAVGYARVLPAAVEAGVEWLLIEQDEADEPPLEAARRSLAAVRAAV